MTERLICLAALVIGYGFGLLQIAQIYSKSKNVNIREKGSGNAGTTNMFRVMGIKAGIITLIGDCAKGVAAVLLTRLLFITICGFAIDPTALALYAGFGCILGHDFPFYFRFKGGKGMATTAALVCCLGSWQMIVLGLIVFFGIVAITRFVSLGSMVTVTAACIEFIIFTQVGWISVDPAWLPDCYILFILLTLLLIYQHRKNIGRLLSGTETKFFFRSSGQIQKDEAAHREKITNAKVEHVQQKAEKKVDRLQSRTERRIEQAQEKNGRKARRVYRIQRRTERRVVYVQNKASYKEQKAQLKSEYKQENSRNWAGRITDHVPRYLKQADDDTNGNK